MSADQVGGLIATVEYGLDDQSQYLGSRHARHDHGREYPAVARHVAMQFSDCADALRQIPTEASQDAAAQCAGFAEELRRQADAAEDEKNGA